MDTFGEALRALRARRGLSLRRLGAKVNYSHGYLHDMERDRKLPSPEVAARLDQALGGQGQLARLAGRLRGPAPEPEPDARGDEMLSRGLPPDRTVVEQLAAVLHVHRQLEDALGSRAVLRPVLGHAGTVSALRAAAGGATHDALLLLDAQFAQFLGWLYQDLEQPMAAGRWYARALGLAHEGADDAMVASVLSMRSNAAWGAGATAQAVRLGEAACRPAATPGVLALSHQQLSRAYATTGRRADALRTLDRAADLTDRAQARRDAEPPWVYFAGPDRLHVQRAICLRELGDHRAAIGAFGAAIAALPTGYRRDRGQYLARLAVTYAQAGDAQSAAQVAAEARELAMATGSARTLAELSRMATGPRSG